MITVPSSLECLVTLLVVTVVYVQRCECFSDFNRIDHLRHFEPVYYDIQSLRHQHHVAKRSSSQPIKFDFHAFGRQFSIHLERDVSIHHPLMVVETEKGMSLYDSSRIYRGHISGDKTSQVHGVITKEGHFEGKLYLPNETYFVERATHHFNEEPEFHTIIYRHSDVTFNATSQTCAHDKLNRKQMEMSEEMTSNHFKPESPSDTPLEDMNYDWKNRYGEEFNHESSIQNGGRKRRALDPLKVTCELYVQADHLYYQRYGNNIDTVIDKLTQYVQAVSTIYNAIDFDGSGSPDNIGFVIKKIKIYTDPMAEGYKYSGNYAVDYFLDKHSEDNYDGFCLSYLFTYRDFDNGVLGLAWIAELSAIGGVCAKNTVVQGVAKSLNTGIVSELNYGTAVPSAVSHVTFAHEIGHNFGSPHDPETDATCTPGGNTGNYIMYARATSGLMPNNAELSSCSIAAIKPIIEKKARSPDGCFVEYKDQICGNRVVEGNEECDCGWAEECEESCCNPQVSNTSALGVETPCTRKSAAVCSPSEGPCCSSNCQYASNTVTCRHASVCLDTSNCDGSSPECPKSEHRANQTECGDDVDFLVCYNGECTGSICLAYGRKSCQCSPVSPGDWSDIRLCQVCCMDGGVCKSSFDLTDIPDKRVAAGTPCLDYQGYCDVFKKCRQVDPSGPLSNLRKLLTSNAVFNTMKEFLTKHWYVGVGGGVVMVIIIVLVVKFCSKSHKPPDQKKATPRTHSHHRTGSRNQVEPNDWM